MKHRRRKSRVSGQPRLVSLQRVADSNHRTDSGCAVRQAGAVNAVVCVTHCNLLARHSLLYGLRPLYQRPTWIWTRRSSLDGQAHNLWLRRERFERTTGTPCIASWPEWAGATRCIGVFVIGGSGVRASSAAGGAFRQFLSAFHPVRTHGFDALHRLPVGIGRMGSHPHW